MKEFFKEILYYIVTVMLCIFAEGIVSRWHIDFRRYIIGAIILLIIGIIIKIVCAIVKKQKVKIK